MPTTFPKQTSTPTNPQLLIVNGEVARSLISGAHTKVQGKRENALSWPSLSCFQRGPCGWKSNV